jgi:hypothetical protein
MVTGAAAGGTSVATLLTDLAPAAGAVEPDAGSTDLPEAAAVALDASSLAASAAPAIADEGMPDPVPPAVAVTAPPVPSVLRDAAAGMTAAAAWSDPAYEPATSADTAATFAPAAIDAVATAPAPSPFGAMPAGPFAAAAAVAGPTPGAYVPPLPSVLLPAGPAAPARAYGSGNGDSAEAAAVAGAPGRAALAVGAVGAMERPRLVDATRWLAVAGAAVAVAGFVLPWATSVIGAGGLGYFDRWGLAGSGHLLLLVALLAVLAMALIKNPLPVWLRVGVPGLGLGALLLGLAWPYVFSSVLGPQLGVYGVALGAVLLIVAGVVAIWSDRHETESRPV